MLQLVVLLITIALFISIAVVTPQMISNKLFLKNNKSMIDLYKKQVSNLSEKEIIKLRLVLRLVVNIIVAVRCIILVFYHAAVSELIPSIFLLSAVHVILTVSSMCTLLQEDLITVIEKYQFNRIGFILTLILHYSYYLLIFHFLSV